MSDPADLVATVGGPVGAAATVAAVMRWLAGKDAAEVSTRLALMEQKLDQLVAGSEKADSMREDVALLKQTVKALHDRVDRVEAKPARRVR